ncbi:hypothetical protein [Nocardioides sp. BYT-33-1]|uniref:hypothetical protein n=1 Tax=Nocardioides sp. BYT-33-1 TaxID=3416952 RepID=UPI003F533264
MESRMDGLATEKTLIALIEGRDRTTAAQMKAMQDDITDLTNALATERAERIAADEREIQARKAADAAEKADREGADKQAEDRTRSAKTLALSAIGTGLAVLGAVVLLINNIGGLR